MKCEICSSSDAKEYDASKTPWTLCNKCSKDLRPDYTKQMRSEEIEIGGCSAIGLAFGVPMFWVGAWGGLVGCAIIAACFCWGLRRASRVPAIKGIKQLEISRRSLSSYLEPVPHKSFDKKSEFIYYY